MLVRVDFEENDRVAVLHCKQEDVTSATIEVEVHDPVLYQKIVNPSATTIEMIRNDAAVR